MCLLLRTSLQFWVTLFVSYSIFIKQLFFGFITPQVLSVYFFYVLNCLCGYVYGCVYAYVYVVCVLICMVLCVFADVYVCMAVCICVWLCACVYVCLCVRATVRVLTDVCVCLFVCACVCECLFVVSMCMRVWMFVCLITNIISNSFKNCDNIKVNCF